jgi:hypothetical protein
VIRSLCIKSATWKYYKYSSLFGRFNLKTCDACRALMRGFHNFSLDVKMIKNVGGPSCLIIKNKLFYNFSK